MIFNIFKLFNFRTELLTRTQLCLRRNFFFSNSERCIFLFPRARRGDVCVSQKTRPGTAPRCACVMYAPALVRAYARAGRAHARLCDARTYRSCGACTYGRARHGDVCVSRKTRPGIPPVYGCVMCAPALVRAYARAGRAHARLCAACT